MNETIKTYTYKIRELDLKPEGIELAMGYDPGSSPPPFPELIQEILDKTPQYCDIEGGFVIKDNVEFNHNNRKIKIDNVWLSPQSIIYKQVKKSGRVAAFVCTAGNEIGSWSSQLMRLGDMMRGYIVDVVGSVVVEMAMDKIHDELEDIIKQEDDNITNRYSPGYCNWDIKEQQELFQLFPDNFCGIQLTESSLMKPIKSVSGIIGIGQNVKREGYHCELCDDEDCLYRNLKFRVG